MIRTHVYLTNNLKQQIEFLAKREGKTEAQVLRELVHMGLKQREQPNETAGDALLRLATLGKDVRISLPPDASARIDDVLYGDDA